MKIIDSLLLLCVVPVALVTVPVAALALAVENSEDSVVFVQERIGKNGIPFNIYKLRTMKNGAVTKVGSFLRKSHIDELLQIINVFNGTMSFIGPRPPVPVEALYLGRRIYGYRNRFLVKPGIFGLAQLKSKGKQPSCFEEEKDKSFYDCHYANTYEEKGWLFNQAIDFLIVYYSIGVMLRLGSQAA